MQTRLEGNAKVKYSRGAYNKYNDKEQWIRLTEGCPHNCPFCYEPQEYKIFAIPKIIRKDVKIMDMNLLAKPEALQILRDLPKANYELVCGIDYRFLTEEIAIELKKKVKKIRLAWDWGINQQYKVKDAVKLLKKVGYQGRSIMVFMICNWKIPYSELCKKLDILKIWGVEVADCYFDNQTAKMGIVPIHWSDIEIKEFRRKCRKHNQLVIHGLDPEVS